MKLGIQFSSVAQLCPTFCDPMDCSTPGLPVHHRLLEFTQTHEACPRRVVLARGFVCVCKGVSEIAVQGWGCLLAGSRPGRVGLAGLSEDREDRWPLPDLPGTAARLCPISLWHPSSFWPREKQTLRSWVSMISFTVSEALASVPPTLSSCCWWGAW